MKILLRVLLLLYCAFLIWNPLSIGQSNQDDTTNFCNSPFNLSLDSITPHQRTIHWESDSNAVAFLGILTTSDSNTVADSIITTDYFLELNNLEDSVTYTFTVAKLCSDTSISAFSAPLLFSLSGSIPVDSTQLCSAPASIDTMWIANDQLLFAWDYSDDTIPFTIYLQSIDSLEIAFSDTSAIAQYLLSGFLPGTYRFQVGRRCDDSISVFSPWIEFNYPLNDSLSDTMLCPPVLDLGAENIKDHSAILTWDSSQEAQLYQVEVAAASDSSFYFFEAKTLHHRVQLIDLSPDSDYRFRVKIFCSESEASLYSDWYYFSSGLSDTLQTCTTPIYMKASSIDESFAMLRWSSVPGAKNYTIVVASADQAPDFHFQATTEDTALIVIGLSPAFDYYFKVMTMCSDSTNSLYSDPFVFNTNQSLNERIENISNKKALDFKLFPNPVSEELTVELPDEQLTDGKISLEIYNDSGQLVWSLIEQDAVPQYRIPVSTLTNGFYKIRIIGKKMNNTASFLLVN